MQGLGYRAARYGGSSRVVPAPKYHLLAAGQRRTKIHNVAQTAVLEGKRGTPVIVVIAGPGVLARPAIVGMWTTFE
jgi:hypothetical protein